MKINNLFNLTYDIDVRYDRSKVVSEFADIFCDVTHIYSYIIYRKYDTFVDEEQDEILSYKVDIKISEIPEYNTIDTSTLADEVLDKIEGPHNIPTTMAVAGYRLPPLEILYDALQPLILSLAQKQHRYWKKLPLDDLCQICALCLVKLYNGGYYIHKQLLDKAFCNEVLRTVRPEKYMPTMVPYDMKVGDGSYTLAETIEDVDAADRLDDITISDKTELFEEQLKIVKEILTPRQYDQLLFEYGTKNTTGYGQGLVRRVKEKLRQENISTQTILNYIKGERK